MIELALIIISFIILSGVLAMIDAALLSVTHAEIEVMIASNQSGASALRSLKNNVTRGVIVVVILTNIVNVLGPILAGQKAVEVYGSASIGILTAILTFGTIIFSEIIPKSIGEHYAPAVSLRVAPFIMAGIWLLYPIVFLLVKLTNTFKSGKRSVGTEEQIRSLATLGRRAGHIESDEGQLVHRAFILNDKTARDIMTPLKDIMYLEDSDKIEDAVKKVFRENHSRYPVVGSSINDIRGVVMSYDILQAVVEGEGEKKVRTITEPMPVVSADMRSDRLLMLFRDKNKHQAVVQEDGKTIGLVTLEDVIEELVGEIEDERDAREDQ